MMNKARDLILKLYKEDHITKEEVDILLDAIVGIDFCNNPRPLPSIYKPEYQPSCAITNNADKTNVE